MTHKCLSQYCPNYNCRRSQLYFNSKSPRVTSRVRHCDTICELNRPDFGGKMMGQYLFDVRTQLPHRLETPARIHSNPFWVQMVLIFGSCKSKFRWKLIDTQSIAISFLKLYICSTQWNEILAISHSNLISISSSSHRIVDSANLLPSYSSVWSESVWYSCANVLSIVAVGPRQMLCLECDCNAENVCVAQVN